MTTAFRALPGASTVLAVALVFTCTRVPPAKSADTASRWTPEKLDVSRLHPLPTKWELTPQHTSFTTADIATRLLRTQQPFTSQTSLLPGATLTESQDWSVLQRGGLFAAMGKAGAAAPTKKLNLPALVVDAQRRLVEFGVPEPELGTVFQSQLRWQERNAAGQLSSIQGGIWKTFILRTFHGIEVSGHRAVFTHGTNGELRKALVAWPPLAASGHLLNTRDSLDQIRSKAVAALEASGQLPSRALLSWRLRPVEDAVGAVRLTLEVAAVVPAAAPQAADEPRALDEEVAVPIEVVP
jgi:hypothetical protein